MQNRVRTVWRSLRALGLGLAVGVAASLLGQGGLGSAPALAGASGAVLDDVTFTDARGRQVSVADYRGRFIVLNVWASWCGPCVVEMPSLDRLQAAFDPEDVLILTLGDGESLDDVRRFFSRKGLDTLQPFADPEQSASARLGIYSLPTTLYIDRQGREIKRVSGMREWDSRGVIEEIRVAAGPRPAPMPAPAYPHDQPTVLTHGGSDRGSDRGGGSLGGASISGDSPMALRGVAEVLDSGTLSLQGEIIRLQGVVPASQRYAKELREYLSQRPIACQVVAERRWRCEVDGSDIAHVVLYNGAGTTTPDAPAHYQEAQAAARSARRGLWGSVHRTEG